MRLCVVPFLLLTALAATGQTVLPLWPGHETGTTGEKDTTTDKDQLIAGKRVERLTGVTNPTIALYRAAETNNTGAAVVVFPGGGYRILALDLEGTEVCEWLNSIGVTCLLAKYRVPDAGPYPKHSEDLADAQRAVRLTREHAVEWKLDPNRVGVLGFSAGGHLAAVLSNHSTEQVYPAIDAADQLSAHPDFAIMIYPGGIVHPPDLAHIGAEVTPTSSAPPTFLVQAEDDPVHVENTTVYFDALKTAGVAAEMHVYAKGGHGYGLRPTVLPVTKWPELANEWLYTIGVLAKRPS
ncbi:MAG TPA: alpha/beta hydrolase [Bryobacteraceae bacterium]|jgi:acetyl esterase/lipase|nr:alpha/beta hydrolase [Bryobacteraceae bacterium]